MIQSIEHKKLWKNHIRKLSTMFNNYIPSIYKNNKYNALIAEFRIDYDLETVVKNVMYFLNESTSNIKWGLYIVHSMDNESHIHRMFNHLSDVHLIKYPYHNTTITDYNNLLKSEEFWNKIDSENILVFQTDSCILRHGIDDFLLYDYIGAPWSKLKEGEFVGNGGFSLRKKSSMLDVIENQNTTQILAEDIFFSKYIDNKPSFEIAGNFSVEDVYNTNPFGLHQPKISLNLLTELFNNSYKNIKIE
jgi:hypothetical protein